jgi:hypothetical protein
MSVSGGSGGPVAGTAGTAGGGGVAGTAGTAGGGGVAGGAGGGADARVGDVGSGSSSGGADAPSVGPDVPGADGPSSDGDDRRDGFAGVTPDGQPWQRMCPEGTSRADCCSLYCGCMVKYCPRTLPASCQGACEAAKTWDLTCRTYQCFASQNPNFPQDHDSHCQHAIGKQGRCGDR